MPLQIEAVFVDGVFKPSQPVSLQQHEAVVLTVTRKPTKLADLAGMLPWKGDPEVLRKIAEDDEFSVLESQH